MKCFILTCAWLMISLISIGQKIYQIRADSVRIYNVCDTAELIIENRTQGVAGFLFNKGRGRTEFRKVRLEKIGNSRIAISGQDTLDLSTLTGLAGVDTIYRSGDNIVYKKYGQLYNVPAPAGTSANYIQNQSATAQPNSSFWISGAGNMRMLKTASPIGEGHWDLYTGTAPINTNIRWTFLLSNTENGSNSGGDLSIQRYADNNGGLINIPFQINRTTGIVNMNNGFRAANQSGITGTGTGTGNISMLSFYENNGSSQVGYVGKANAPNTDIYLTGNMAGVALLPANGIVTMANSTKNLLTFGGAGLGAPTVTTRSIGTKITLLDYLSAANTDYALGMETSNMWFSVPQNVVTNGFKWYAGTTLVSRMDGTGSQEWNNLGRFKGFTGGGTGAGAEVYFAAGSAYLSGFDRTAGVYTPVILQGGTTATGRTFIIDGQGYRFPMFPNVGILGTDANGYLINKASAFAPSNMPLSTVLTNGNTANNNILLGATTSTNPYGISVSRLIGTMGTTINVGITSLGGNNGALSLNANNGTDPQRTLYVEANGTAPLYSLDAGVTRYQMWHANNHPAGNAFTPTLTGANVLATLVTNAAGHITAATTRALTPADIGAAPNGGSGNYIQNQTTAVQSGAGFWTAGPGIANRFGAVGQVATTTGDVGFYEGTSAAGTNQRWRIIRSGAEGTGNTGNDFNLQSLTNTGVLWANPLSINRSTSIVTMAGGFRAATGSGVVKSGANSLLYYYAPDNVARAGYTGDINGDMFVVSDNGNVNLRPGAGNQVFSLSPTSLTLTTGGLILANATSNILTFANAGTATPTFNSTSIGTKLKFFGEPSASAVSYAIGIEGTAGSPSMWFSVPQSNTSYGFKWYGGTTIVSRMGATGNQEWLGAGRFQGAPSPVSDGTGTAIELGYVNGTGVVQSINKPGNLYMPTRVIGGSGAASPAFKTLLIDNTGYKIDLVNAGVLGTNASGYLVDKAASFAGATHTHTLTLTGAVTGTGVVTGSIATTLANFDAAKITTGTIAAARLGAGTANNTTFLRGDGTWQVVAATTPTLQAVTTAGATTSVAITSTNTITSTGFYQSSLRSLKQNIHDYTGDATGIINRISIKEFEYKKNPGKKVVGIIADDEPEIISGKDHDRFDMMNATGLLLKSIQELSQQNEKLKQTSGQLQTENDNLKKELHSLAERMEKLEKQSSK